MRINDSRPASAARATQRYGAVAGSAAEAQAPRRIEDSASVMGIPEEEMTPKVRSALMTLMQEVERVRRELDAAQKRLAELERLADQDALVPMANRRAFVRELGRMISFADRYNIPTSIIYFDVNDLKAINDSLGHTAGDAAIVHVGTVLKARTRESDLLGRLGGDEFAVVLPNAEEQAAHDKAHALAQAIFDTPLAWKDQVLHVRVAYGVYSFKPGEDVAKALAEADRKMYDHKRQLKEARSA